MCGMTIGSRVTAHCDHACLTDDPAPPQVVAGFTDQSTRQWNLEKLNTYFLPMDSDVIQSIPISSV
jgi:hypothetical protein